MSPKIEGVKSPATPPVPSLPGKGNDPWAPVLGGQLAAASPDEDEFAAISNRNLSNHPSGKRRISVNF